MKFYRKPFLILFLQAFSYSSFAVVHDIKTVGATFSPDTTYAELGDSIKFIISIGHDVLEITNDSYNTNVTSAFPGGFGFPSGTYYYVLNEAKTYYFGCTYHLAASQMKGVIIVSDPSAILLQNSEDLFLIYPNPTSDIIYIQTSNSTKDMSVQFFNLRGGLVYTARNIDTFKNGIDMSNLNSGIYILFIQIEDKSYQFRIVKE